MKPKLYYRVDENGIPFDNFCSDACIGANAQDIKCIPFSNIKDVPYNPYHIVVTSVEESQEWLGRRVEAIDDSWARQFKGREEHSSTLEAVYNFPCFVKPATEVKAFTGLIVNNDRELRLFTNNFDGILSVQEVVEIESEYRLYYTDGRGVLGIKHYLGNPYITPDEGFVEMVLKSAKEKLKEKSFTLDFGIKENGETFLIEVNDGWAIGNYGLSPDKYYSFVKNRWLQLTGILSPQ